MTTFDWVSSGIVIALAIGVLISIIIGRRNENRLYEQLRDLKKEEAETIYPLKY